MAKKLMTWKTKGMNKDLSVSAFNPEFSFENMNLRLQTNENNTLMSWVNERGTAGIEIVYDKPNDHQYWDGVEGHPCKVTAIEGTPIGTADNIYTFQYANAAKTQMRGIELYSGNLGFDTEHPIETLVSYEAENVQKVYWTDGKNQPRLINIAKWPYKDAELEQKIYNDTSFDFVPTLQLQEEVAVKKLFESTGIFAPGVIQYAFTYYNKNGQETNIFYTTPLYYISYIGRGASPEDRVGNAFKITVTGVDGNFDYLRIYSIQRTSLNGTPIVKRIQDISTKGLSSVPDSNPPILVAEYLDTGTSGNTVDPMELLYKGGEVIKAGTITQKDNTLFLGNIEQKGTVSIGAFKTDIKKWFDEDQHRLICDRREFIADMENKVSNNVSTYIYANQLSAYLGSESVPCAGFKYGDKYRLGLQFQHKSGKWSEPVWIGDKIQEYKPQKIISGNPIGREEVSVPIFKGHLSDEIIASLIGAGYKKVRPVVVFPKMQDRNIVCQGVVNPTLYTNNHRCTRSNTYPNATHDLQAQSSWFFRATNGGKVGVDKSVFPSSTGTLITTNNGIDSDAPKQGDTAYNPNTDLYNIRLVEVQGDFDDNNKFIIDRAFLTFHSPDVEFDEQMSLMDFNSVSYRQLGWSNISTTFSDISIQTETPTTSNNAGGFVHKSFSNGLSYGIVSGLFYDDYLVEDWGNNAGVNNALTTLQVQRSSAKWMVYLWNKSGSLNNDINRPAERGVATSVLKKKVISNLRYAINNSFLPNIPSVPSDFIAAPKLFSSNEVSIVKIGEDIYMGNIDTSIIPDSSDGLYFAFNSDNITAEFVETDFSQAVEWKTFSLKENNADKQGLYRYDTSQTPYKWSRVGGDAAKLGNQYLDLVIKKEAVRMKYKSSPHIVFKVGSGIIWEESSDSGYRLPILEITQTPVQPFGGDSADALRENVWIPCGKPIKLKLNCTLSDKTIKWEWGDTYYQRWDCLKTYPFTSEDINQVVEIGSFILETHINIDGRYDRNRGQLSNLNMTPRNFNLLNPVYSQLNNFFTYRILPEDTYENTKYPNQITWSKTKENGADVDLWTNMTLAATLNMDGDKGEITALRRLNDQLICFQDSGVSQILYNENTQISTTEGVPIEIANSGKVQGKRYISNTIGCSNKWSIVTSPAGLYFMDSNEKSIYRLGDGLQNISLQGGFNTWCKQIPSATTKWYPNNFNGNFVGCYDGLNQDVLYINEDTALAFSERLNAFTSFYDYGNTPFLCNLDDTGIWVKSSKNGTDYILWRHQTGDYCKFFGTNKPYWMILVGNPEPQLDKQFTNMEFRASVDGDGEYNDNTGKFTPTLPFDSLETWNEYQHGYTGLSIKNGHSQFIHGGNSSALIRKFRIWRSDIPRNNCLLDTKRAPGTTYPYSTDADIKISRHIRKANDRIRNPWLYLKLMKAEAGASSSLPRVELHDFIMTYYD